MSRQKIFKKLSVVFYEKDIQLFEDFSKLALEKDDNMSRYVKRMIQEAKDTKTAIDATYGRRTRSVIVMDSGHIILSAIQPETIANRADNTAEIEEEEE